MSNDGRVIINIDSNAQKAAQDFNALDRAVKKTDTDTKAFSGSANVLKNALGAISVGYVTSQLVNLGKSAVNTSMDFQALVNRMNAAAGNKSIGADSLAYIREQADRLGLEFRTTADSFAGFEAAALRSGLTLEQTKQIFTDVSTAATSMQLSTEKVQLVFKALEQISGKGTVSMEELRQQLGDSLPGAFEIAAQSMGMTTRAFYDAVASGEVLSSEFLPKFAKAIREQLGGSAEEASTQLRASLNRLNTDLMDSSNAWGTLLQPSVQKGVEALREAAQASTSLAKTLKFSPEITSTATSIAAATTATLGLSTALRTIIPILATIPPTLAAIRNGTIAINLAGLLNPIGLISAAIGGVTYALVRNKLAIDDAKRSTDLFKESLNLETSEAARQLREYGELINIKNKTNSQVERLKELTEELTSKYPQYIDKLRQELTLKGKISQATAEQIANEMTLAKVKQLQNKKDDIDKQVAAQQRAYRFSNTFAAARFGAPIDTTSGRQGVRKYLQIQQDELKKQLKAAKDNRQKIIKELTFSYDDYSLAPSIGGLGGSDDKKGTSEKVKGPFALLQEAAAQAKTELDDLAAKGITSGKVWDSQVAKVNQLSSALERVKQATDLSVIPPFQALNTEIQKAQERVNNLAASKIVNLTDLRQAKSELTSLQKRLYDVQQAATTSPYQQKQNQVNYLQGQLQDMVISGQQNSPGFNALKNQLREAQNEITRANTAVSNSVGLTWNNISSTISTQLSSALTTPLQEGENAFERLGNVALNVISQIGQSLISQVLNNAIEKIAARGTDGVMTGAAAAVTQTAQGYASMAASTNVAAAGITKIASSQTAATAALTSSAATVAGAAATYKTAAVSAGQLASSITQAAISQAAYSAALVPIAGAVLAPVAALATGTSIAAANVVASAGMLASRITAFKDGGVVNSPTLFPMAGNRTGLMGERGAEAIMPLKRTPSGQLGVQAQVQQPSINIYNQSGANIETVQRPDGETDIFIKRVNSALRSERTQSGFSSALQRNQSRGVQAS